MSDSPVTGGNMSPEGERAAKLLQHANFRKVGDAIGVSRSQVALWAQGKQVTPYRLMQLEQLLGQQETAAAPSWAAAMEERLVERLDRNRQLIERLIPEEAAANIAAVIELLEEPLQQRGEGPPEGSDEPGPGGPGSQVQANGSPPSQGPER